MAKPGELPPDDPAAAQVWRDFFLTAKTSITEAMGYFLIDVEMPPREDDDEGPDDQEVKYEPFDLRAKMSEMLDWTERYFWRLKRRAARIICLKCRRYGVSTFFRLFALVMVLRIPGYQALLIAQDDVSARRHFQSIRDAFAQIPKWILKERGIEIIKDTDSQLVLRHEGHKTSEFHVAPAKRGALGRGGRFNFIIVTEFPHYAKAVKKDLSGVLAACRNERGNVIVFEATAKGYEEFRNRYVRAAKRRSDYRAQFIAAFDHPGNRKPFESPAAEDAFIASIGTLKEFGVEDELVLFRRLTIDMKWTPHDAAEHMNWRRTEITDVCEGVLDVYYRENPNTPDEAFTGTGKPVLPKQILKAWRPFAEAREEKAERGFLIQRKKIDFHADHRGDLVVFERPIEGVIYAFGTDVASGVAVHADGKTEADFSYSVFKNARTKFTVARLRLHIPPTELAEQTFQLARWYGCDYRAGYIERSINDSGVCINHFEDLEHEGVFGADLLLGQRVLIKTDDANLRANWRWTPGHKTTQKTKPKLVQNIRKEILGFGLPALNADCPFDIQFIEEAMKFERNEDTGWMGAIEGHDDGVIAEGLALEACERVLEDIPQESVHTPVGGDPGWEILMRHSAGVRAQESQDEERVADGDIEGLPGY